MHLLYIHQYFCTPYEPGGNRSYWIAKELVRRGHQVTMITSSKGGREPGKRNIDGIEVVYVDNPAYNNYMSAPKKVWAFCAFIFNAIKAAKKEKDVDIVFATSTPLTVGAIALRLKARKKWKYVFEVRDLWPEFPIEIGAIKNKAAICRPSSALTAGTKRLPSSVKTSSRESSLRRILLCCIQVLLSYFAIRLFLFKHFSTKKSIKIRKK